MKKRYMLISSLILAALLGGGAVWNNSRSAAHSGPPVAAYEEELNSLVKINKKARAAKAGGETETRELVDEMFRSLDFAQQFAELDDSIKDRLVRAELNHKKRHGNSNCSEQRVVHAVNLLGDRIGTPAYTRTDVFEVRRLRANLLLYTSDLQERRDKNGLGKGQKHDVMMSPLETFFVTATLIQQKLSNPEYQLTNDEWIALHGGKRTTGGTQKFNDEMKQRRIDSTRSEEVHKALIAGISAMGPFEALSLRDELLTTLGIER